MELDRLDEQILAELDNNARQSNSRIAKKLRVNKNVVNYRIKNLEKAGVISGYYGVIDNYRLGYSSYRAYLKLRNAGPKKEKQIMDYLVKLPQTWWIGSIKGRFNMGALFLVKTQKEFVDVWNELHELFREFVNEERVVVYCGLEHYRLPFTKKCLREDAGFESVGVGETTEVDKTDMELLRFISENGRASLIEIAKKVNLTPAAISYRIRQLERKKVILGYRAVVDMARLGYTLYKVDINLKDAEKYGTVQRFARAHENIFYLDKTVGWADAEISVYARSPQQFYSIMDGIREKFTEEITDYDFFAYSEITKIVYMPVE
ncbi:MAG: winged helix-turn-helix transcriptional regulator [Candidatus Micrarchaeota archaeon]